MRETQFVINLPNFLQVNWLVPVVVTGYSAAKCSNLDVSNIKLFSV